MPYVNGAVNHNSFALEFKKPIKEIMTSQELVQHSKIPVLISVQI